MACNLDVALLVVQYELSEQGYTPNSELMICSPVNISGREHRVLGYNDLPLKVKEEYTHIRACTAYFQDAHLTHAHRNVPVM